MSVWQPHVHGEQEREQEQEGGKVQGQGQGQGEEREAEHVPGKKQDINKDNEHKAKGNSKLYPRKYIPLLGP